MMGNFGNSERMLQHLQRRLELDDQQAVTVGNILGAASSEIDALRDRGRSLREAIAALDTSDPDYDVRLQNLSVETGEIATEMTLLHGRIRSEISAELSMDQRQKLADGRGHMRDWSGGRHHRGSIDSDDIE